MMHLLLFSILFIQVEANKVFSGIAVGLDRLASAHSSELSVAKSDQGKAAISAKFNGQISELVATITSRDVEFEYLIRELSVKEGKCTIFLDPPLPFAKLKSVRVRSLKVIVESDQGEHLFPGDLLRFKGRLKTGNAERSALAVPFASFQSRDLKTTAIWIDDVVLGESRANDITSEPARKVASVDSLTPELLIKEVDRLFKAAQKEVSAGKTTADKQDAANKHFDSIRDAVEALNERPFHFELKIRDVKKGESTNRVFVLLSPPEMLRSFKGGAPLVATSEISLDIADEDRQEFRIGRKLEMNGVLSVRNDGIKPVDSIYVGSISVNSQWIARSVVDTESEKYLLYLTEHTEELTK